MRFKRLIIFGIVALAVFLIFFAFSLRGIYTGVKEICDEYQGRFGGESCAQSLMMSIDSIETSVQEKNDALWALSQLGREESLPFLYQLEKQQNERLSDIMLHRAIRFSERWTLTKWMYKNL
ncbi:hypothetical protein JW752_05395 [Candidatus Peregrinibacteria bacterium]|nr:hypothetical protein [Candidatus Peregrinibacteria bacterium]